LVRQREYSPNQLKRTIDAGGVGRMAMGPNSSDICDFLGHIGFDAAFVDFEHGGVSWSELSDITRACELWGMSSVVRVNKLDEAQILRTLDQGASAVMIPHIITVEQAEFAANACKYPPTGVRGVAGGRMQYGVDEYFHKANDEVQCIALIEDFDAIENLPEMTKVEGMDIFYVAPSDMAASMGLTGNPGHPDVQAAIDRAIGLVIENGGTAGTLTNDSNIARYLAMGVKCVGVPWQQWVMQSGTTFIKRTRSAN